MPKTGDDDSGGESDAESLERHYRLTLDFRLLVGTITPEPCRENFLDHGSALAREPYSGEEIERQRRLYALLRKNKDVLERYLLTVVANEAVGFVFSGLVEAFGLAEDEDLLAPLYAEMSEEDEQYFKGCAQAGTVWESTGLVAKAFAVEWVGAECAEMSRRVVGDLTKAGAVGRAKTRTHLLKRDSSRRMSQVADAVSRNACTVGVGYESGRREREDRGQGDR